MTGNVSKAKGLTPADVVMKTDVTNEVNVLNNNPVSSNGVCNALYDGKHNALASVSSQGGHSGTLSASDKEKLDSLKITTTNITPDNPNNISSGAVHAALTGNDFNATPTGTGAKSGTMSPADKAKLNGIESEANKTVVATLVKASENNPVSGAAVHAAIKSSNYLATGQSNGTVSAAERQKLQNLTLYEKDTHTIYPDAPLPFELEANSFNNLGKLVSAITLKLPTVKGDDNVPVEYGDIIQLDFYTGSTAYNVGLYTNSAPCTVIDYSPTANTIYSILFSYGAIGEESSETVYGWRAKTTTYQMPIT